MFYIDDYERLEECKLIYELLVKEKLTLRQVEEETGIPYSTIRRRIKLMEYKEPFLYDDIQDALEYNRQYKSKRRSTWE